MLDSAFLSVEELHRFGFAEVGANVQVSRKASFYGVSGRIGANSRIDDFSIIKGRVDIGACVHIAAYVHVGGHRDGVVTLEDCSALSCHVSVFAATANYRAAAISNPTVPIEMQSNLIGPITFGAGSVVGAGCVVLPNVVVGEGTSVGAHLVVHRSIPAGKVVASRNGRMEIVGERDVETIRRFVALARGG